MGAVPPWWILLPLVNLPIEPEPARQTGLDYTPQLASDGVHFHGHSTGVARRQTATQPPADAFPRCPKFLAHSTHDGPRQANVGITWTQSSFITHAGPAYRLTHRPPYVPQRVMTMKRLPLLLLLAACSSERAPRATSVASSPDGAPRAAAALAPEAPSALSASYTTPWTDSSRQGGATVYSRGRVITTVAVHTDSQWAVTPPVKLGLPYGPTQLPVDSLCSMDYTATTLPVIPARVLRDLDRARECGARIIPNIRRAKLKDAYGYLSVSAARSELDTWPWDVLCARVKDSTIIAFHVGDDVTLKEWGPDPLPVKLARWDSIAGIVTEKCPQAATVLRAVPTTLEARGKWQWLTTGWAQYPGPRRRWGSPEKFFSTEIASAKRQGLGIVAGVNLINGGCGTTALCLPDVPGTPLAGTNDGRYQLSSAELTYYKAVSMSDPYVCASVDWGWGPVFKSDFHGRPEIQSAAKAIGVIAKQRPATSCIQRKRDG